MSASLSIPPSGLTSNAVETTATARRLAERLRNELRRVLEAIPEAYRPVTRMSEWTGVPKPICFRVIAAGRPQAEPLGVIDVLPGVDGLERTLNAAARLLKDHAVTTSAAQTVKTYRELPDLLGGTQAKARRAVAALVRAPAGQDDPTVNQRRAAFESARGITGVWSDVLSIVHCITPPSSPDNFLSVTTSTGHVGLHAGHAHLPVTFTWQTRTQVPENVTTTFVDRPHGLNPYSLLTGFSTEPFPKITSSGEKGFERDVIDWDSESLSSGKEVDVFVALRGRVPCPTGNFESHAVTRIPTRRLCVDLLLPLELGFSGRAFGGAYFIGFGGVVRDDPAARWYDRLHDVPPVFDSAAPAEGNPEVVFSRHEELVDHLLTEASVVRGEVRHLRWITRFPLWGSDYSIRVAR